MNGHVADTSNSSPRVSKLWPIGQIWLQPVFGRQPSFIYRSWVFAGSLAHQFSSVQSLSLVRLFATPWIAARQASLSITNSRSLLKLMLIESVMSSTHLILCRPLPLPASGSFPVSQLFTWGGQSIGVSELQHQSFQWTLTTYLLQDGLVGSPCSPRDSQESFPTPQFKSINFSALSFLYGPTLTSIHDYWKNRSFD